VISSNQTSAISAADLPPPSQQKRASWPFAATLVCASLLGIALAFCVRTALPAFALDGEFFSSSVVCSNANSTASQQAARTGD
jgi:flagellar biosynthesis protein FliR